MTSWNIKENLLQDILSEDVDTFPLLNPMEMEEIQQYEIPSTIPILPLRNTVMFPGIVIPITVGREKSIELVNDNHKQKNLIGVITQKDENIQDPGEEDLYKIGTLSSILKAYRMADGSTTIIVRGLRLFKIEKITTTHPYLKALVSKYETNDLDKTIIESDKFKATMASLKEVTEKYMKLSSTHHFSPE
ncbi:MAG TPA: LON peptidase substrate-binding domain-containing protein, partial [Bacteroidales bacterium]|nr:LON peptidase substrate-binding domain-containing protein [Bacteroidales bacterium]